MANRLALETSPYLQQHADNPVDWHAWGEEALTLARVQDKPIMLSVGYSACHWCHVMAHESFEDPEVAAVMNQLFVNIKVDREERPDLDQIYQTAHALLTRRNGGWPLTMFLMPDQRPFFGGTYFPKQARHGMMGFVDLLQRVAQAYRDQRAQIEQQNGALMAALQGGLAPAPGEHPTLDPAPLEGTLGELSGIFDSVEGGLGNAPKFPHPAELEFLLRRAAAERDDRALHMARLTLLKMAHGGIFDQLGGGFCRYSVDRYWSIPHFEKMLYDNGPLLSLYSDLWLLDSQPLYQRTAAATAAWVMREMQSAQGGYYSSLDADSEHEEGKFYVWTPDEVKRTLTMKEYTVLAAHYGLDGPPNFEERYWHLRVITPLADVSHRLDLAPDAARALLDAGRDKLMAIREQRVRPGRDEKILTSWNALMIKGMAHAARVFGQAQWLRSAQSAADFVRCTLWQHGRLLATYKDGRAHLNAYLDDYAFMVDALLELFQTECRPEDLEWAQQLADVLLEQFEDRANGGFYFVSHDHEKLICRTKAAHDNATPSGNGIAAHALQRLGHILGEARYIDAAQRTLQAFSQQLHDRPSAHVSLCKALDEHMHPPSVVLVAGDRLQMREWQRELAAVYRPRVMTLVLPDNSQDVPAILRRPMPATGVTAWMCHGSACLPPVSQLHSLLRALDDAGTGQPVA